MKKILALALVLLMVPALSGCQGNTSTDAQESTPAGSAESSAEQVEDVAEDEEEPVEEEEVVEASMVAGENSVSVVSGGDTLVEFTLPTETPIYTKLKYLENDGVGMMTHNVMDGMGGRTIVEYFEGSAQDYLDYGADVAGVDEATATTETKDLNGREVLICKSSEQTTNNLGTATNSLTCVVAVPLNDDVALGFRINADYATDSSLVFDDSVIDILLSHCVF